MRLKRHEIDLLCSIASKTEDDINFEYYETEFLFDLADRIKLNKKQKRELI